MAFVLFSCSEVTVWAESSSTRIFCRPELGIARRDELAALLREITGWSELDFNEAGELSFGSANAIGGSSTARSLLKSAGTRDIVLVLEDASDRSEVVFSRVLAGRWTSSTSVNPAAYVLQIDFNDFSRLSGDRDALAAFNAGWGVLHEIAHVVNGSKDAERAGQAGECEDLINAMRRECGLAERAEYHFQFVPGVERSHFKTKFVRLAFDRLEPVTNRKQRLWLVWDADLVGGLGQTKH